MPVPETVFVAAWECDEIEVDYLLARLSTSELRLLVEACDLIKERVQEIWRCAR